MAGSRNRIPFGHKMRGRLLVEKQREVGVHPPEETGHFRFWVPIFLGDDDELQKSGKRKIKKKGFPLSLEEACWFKKPQDCVRDLSRVSGGGLRERQSGEGEEKS